MKTITIFGVSGSIGKQVIEVVRNLKIKGYDLQIQGIASYGRDIPFIKNIIKEFKVANVALIKNNLLLKTCESTVFSLKEELDKFLNQCQSSIYINAINGIDGIRVTYELLQRNAQILMANKESLISLAHLFPKQTITNIIPIDSEHIAIKRLLHHSEKTNLKEIILTATGGAVLKEKIGDFSKFTLKEILNHPKWSMGKQITVNSSTMANKAIEVVEAKYLFDLEIEKIKAIIHPEAIIHGMVRNHNGTVMASMAINDMRIVIEEALLWPKQLLNNSNKDIIFDKFTFQEIKEERYPLYFTLLKAFDIGISNLIGANIANECAVELFLKGKIPFIKINTIVSSTLKIKYPNVNGVKAFEELKNEIEKKLYSDFL